MSTLPFKLVYQAKRKSILCYSLPSCISLCVDETQKRRLWELPAAPSNPGDRFTGDLTINELEGEKKGTIIIISIKCAAAGCNLLPWFAAHPSL